MRFMRNAHILAIDVGGGSLRAALVRVDGTIVASSAVVLAADEPHPGWAELDPEAWWQAFRRASARVLRNAPPPSAICVCALTRTQVLLDADGRTLGRAMLFRDRRAAAVARELDGATAFDARARLTWIERHQPARFAKIATVVEPKDYLNFRLTGVVAADSVTRSRDAQTSPSTLFPSGRAQMQQRPDDEPVAERPSARDSRKSASPPLGTGGVIAPPPFATANVITPWQQVGVVQARTIPRLAGVPVFAGALDTWASAVGAGAVAPGQAYDVAGTSEAVGLVTTEPVTAPGLLRLAWTETAHQIGGPTQAGADCARWCHESFRVHGTLAVAIERVGPKLRNNAPLFLPYLAGERAPVWSSAVRGAFHGIDRAHGPDDFLWSTLEGVAHAVGDILRRAQASAGVTAHELRVCGGGARSDAWCALKADVLGLPVLRSRAAETGVVGAAMAAAVGIGAYPDLVHAARRMAGVGRRFVPHARYAAAYLHRAADYDAIRRAALELAEPA